MAKYYKLSFKDWLINNYNDSNCNIGDLARDVMMDESFPLGTIKKDCRRYLQFKNACKECLNTFEEAWEKYDLYKSCSCKGEWGNTYEYRRILEVLDDYWLTEPDELEVTVIMEFLHANGETQSKCIGWRNPKYLNKLKESQGKTILEIVNDNKEKGE